MRVWVSAVIETARLAVAVLLYTDWAPRLKDLFPELPIIGESLAAILAATVVLVASWILIPVGRAVVDVERFSNNVPYSGPALDLECAPHSIVVATYGLKVRYEGFGLIARGIATRLAKQGVELASIIDTDRLTLHSEDLSADEERLDRGVVIKLGGSPTGASWEYVKLTVDSGDVPSKLDVDVRTELLYPNKRPWYFFMMWSTSNVKKILLMNKEGHP